MTVRLIVYGLLRRGEPMHGLLTGAEFLGEVRIDGYELRNLGDYPAAVPGAGAIAGELYELPSPAVLEVLDEAEGVHAVPPLYRRELVHALGAPAWLYVFAQPPGGAPGIGSGDWLRR